MIGWRLLGLGLFLALALAGCAGGDDADNGKNHGFYGGVNGGWSEPRPQ